MWEYKFITSKKKTVDKINKFIELLGVKGTTIIVNKREKDKEQLEEKKKALNIHLLSMTKILEVCATIVAEECEIDSKYLSYKTTEQKVTRARDIFIYVIDKQFSYIKRRVISTYLNKCLSTSTEAIKRVSIKLDSKFAHIPENQKVKISIENIEKKIQESKRIKELVDKIKKDGETIKQKRLNSKRVGSTNTEQQL